MTAILGLAAFHPDASACLVIDGQLVGAVAEERLGARQKHTADFPAYAVRHLLADAGITLADVSHVAMGRQTSANRAAKLRYLLAKPANGINAVTSALRRHKATLGLTELLAHACDMDPALVMAESHFVEHHVSHIASAYYCSPFEQATAGFSIDGSGDFVSGMAARCEGTRIEVLDKVTLPASLGHFYTALCQFIGFDLFGEEYKVMGLAPYGHDRYAAEMARIVRLEGTDWYRVDGKYLDVWNGLAASEVNAAGQLRMGTIYSAALEQLFGPPRRREDPVTQREMDIARSTQAMFERAVSQCLTSLGDRVPLTRLAMAGGCALNGVMNARAYRDFPIGHAYLHAAASDDGTAVGAAFHCWHEKLSRPERFHMTHAFWGPEHGHEAIRRALDGCTLPVRECASADEAVEIAAELIAGGAVTGWYQGRSEWGPRALGNRSILANPAIPDMKERINRKIKRRENFRPFAPALLRADVSRYFEQDIDSPFMMHVVKFREKWRETFPAVTHVDGTGRLQSVAEDNNPLFFRLLTAMKRRTGHGMLLNTSFNENEPVVDTPAQALDCFLRTDMDALVMGRFVIEKARADGPAAPPAGAD
ncbi:carbamoyltransferase family protein [Qipengyuania marisflavi]|uniref:Carbamoyltransferase n=1 Tax=Qipengyuania marisflavi TaxID=2486356 RepID=A0A5S3P869_9SPHN|nr:carbamoyltransferase C-terminal domain-containing protein [Qipengyuania marisflavi]TMM47122.1 carbamoyltransferase [Qipengyuania marisflavi]